MSRETFQALKFGYKAPIVGAIAVALLVAACSYWAFATWLAGELGIPPNAPVRDQPHGALWMVISLLFFFVIMSAVLTGLLTMVANRWAKRQGWSREQARAVLFRSEFPEDWFKKRS